MRENICDQIDFILKGGLWEKITGELVKFTPSALIVEVNNDDIIVIEAVKAELDRLIFKDIGGELLSYSPDVSPIHKLYFDNFSIPPIPQLGEWTNVIRFCGKEWAVYILIRETPSQELLNALRPYLKVIVLWTSLRLSSQLEERLSALSYMILATKNTLASIFEPMTIEYYADFLRGVLVESLFPRKMATYIDDGASIKLLNGDDLGSLERSGVFASKILSPMPIILKIEEAGKIGFHTQLINGTSVFILPIAYTTPKKHGYRLFCTGILENPTQEKLNFMELLGNVASKALEIMYLYDTMEQNSKQLASKSYTVAAFYNVFQKLISQTERIDFLAFFLGFFNETSLAERIKLVVYDTRESKYFLVGESFNGIMAQCFDPLTETMERITGNGEGEIDEFGLEFLGFKFKDTPVCKAYPLWIGNKLEGFVAMYNMSHETEIHDYPVVFRTFCQIAAREFYFRFNQ